MRLHESARDVQAQAEAVRALAVADAHELLEDARLVFGRDAHAAILHPDRDGVGQRLQPHFDRLTGAVAQRVREQVHHDLLQAKLVVLADQRFDVRDQRDGRVVVP
jgi:hypothetical protein